MMDEKTIREALEKAVEAMCRTTDEYEYVQEHLVEDLLPHLVRALQEAK